jgi:hypothetical protein
MVVLAAVTFATDRGVRDGRQVGDGIVSGVECVVAPRRQGQNCPHESERAPAAAPTTFAVR